jgi:hypothetical protein
MWKTSFWTCVPLSKTIVMIIFRSVLWAAIHSFPQRHKNEWIPKISMVWSHWHHDKWITIRCGKPRQIRNVVMKSTKYRQNANVVGWVNNQAFAPRPTHEWRCACMIFLKTSIRRETNYCSCMWSIKETYNWG